MFNFNNEDDIKKYIESLKNKYLGKAPNTPPAHDPFDSLATNFAANPLMQNWLTQFTSSEAGVDTFYQHAERNAMIKLMGEIINFESPKSNLTQNTDPLSTLQQLFGGMGGLLGGLPIIGMNMMPQEYVERKPKLDILKPPPSEKFKKLPADYLSSKSLESLAHIKKCFHTKPEDKKEE